MTRFSSATINPRNRIKWGRGRTRIFRGKLSELRQHLPRFELRFGMRGDMRVMRQPLIAGESDRLIARVSNRYSLVQHHEVLDVAEALLPRFEAEPNDAMAELVMTPHGERMDLTVELPSARYTPSDGYALATRMRLLNSVDTSTALFGSLEFLRKICSNGMVGWNGSRVRRTHTQSLALSQVRNRLLSQFDQLWQDTAYFEQMLAHRIDREKLAQWVDEAVAKTWDRWAAARVFHVATSGHDGDVICRPDLPPHRTALQNCMLAPGACAPASNVYHVAQALSFVASRLVSWSDRYRRLADIPRLLEPLMN
jgi:hypothetical protein